MKSMEPMDLTDLSGVQSYQNSPDQNTHLSDKHGQMRKVNLLGQLNSLSPPQSRRQRKIHSVPLRKIVNETIIAFMRSTTPLQKAHSTSPLLVNQVSHVGIKKLLYLICQLLIESEKNMIKVRHGDIEKQQAMYLCNKNLHKIKKISKKSRLKNI